jgi:hypothetical protein
MFADKPEVMCGGVQTALKMECLRDVRSSFASPGSGQPQDQLVCAYRIRREESTLISAQRFPSPT